MDDPGTQKFARLKLIVRPGLSEERAGDQVGPRSAMDRMVRRTLLSRSVVPLAVLAGILVAGALLYMLQRLPAALTVDANRLSLSSAGTAEFREYIPVTGNIVPARTAFLDAVEGGQVTQVFGEEGQMVEAGEALLELKNTDLQLRLVEAEARLTEQVNNLNLRRLQMEQTHLQLQERLIGIDEQIVALDRDLVRSERLLESGTVALKTVEDMRGALTALRDVRATVLETQQVNRSLQSSQTAQMQSSVDAIALNLGVARDNLKNLVMRAPFAGQLTAFEAEVGEAKSRGQRIGQIDGTADFKVSALVDEFYLGRVALGQIASVQIGSGSHTVEVSKIYPNVRDRQFQIDLKFLHEQPEQVRRGQTLRMNLEIGAHSQSLVVANGPWVDDTGGTWVFVLSQDGSEAHRRAISIGRRNPEMVEITGGISAEDRVITSSYASLKEFDRIDIRSSARDQP